MMNHKVEYSVVIPVYNGEKTLIEVFLRIKTVFEKLEKTFEVIFVEDCGQDNSWNLLKELKLRYPEYLTIIRLSKNFGQHNAIMCGFNHVKGEFVITIDDDLQIPPEEIHKLIDVQIENQSDVVYGVYEQKKHNFFRNIGSYCIQQIFKFVFKSDGPITAFRLIKSSLAHKIRDHTQSFVFIDGFIHWHTKHITRTLVLHNPRLHGESGYSVRKLLTLSANLLLSFTTLPLRLITFLGFVIAILSFGIGLTFTIRKLIYDVPMGYTSIIVSIFFTAGIMLLVMGILGEYISRIFQLQNDRPQFSINEVI